MVVNFRIVLGNDEKLISLPLSFESLKDLWKAFGGFLCRGRLLAGKIMGY